jgi:hypothetical protein
MSINLREVLHFLYLDRMCFKVLYQGFAISRSARLLALAGI